MLNFEYARLVDDERRRIADRRSDQERLIRESRPVPTATHEDHPRPRRPAADPRGLPRHAG